MISSPNQLHQTTTMTTSDSADQQKSYDEDFKREAHKIIKEMAVLDSLFPWGDINKVEKLFHIYEAFKYVIDKKLKTISIPIDHYSTSLTLKDLEELVKSSVEAALSPKESADTLHCVADVDEDGVIVIPDELLDALGWKEGDDLYWDIRPDGAVILSKVKTEGEVEDEN